MTRNFEETSSTSAALQHGRPGERPQEAPARLRFARFSTFLLGFGRRCVADSMGMFRQGVYIQDSPAAGEVF